VSAHPVSAPRGLLIAVTLGLLAEFVACVLIVALYVLA
jgi:hypothetical protein